MTRAACPHAASGCNYPEGDCAGLCVRPDTLVVKQVRPEVAVYLTSAQGCPRWVSRPELGQAFPEQVAANLAQVLSSIHGPHFRTQPAARQA